MRAHAVRGAASILSPLHTPCSWLTPCGRIAFALWEPCSVSEQVIHSFIRSFAHLFTLTLSHSYLLDKRVLCACYVPGTSFFCPLGFR